MGPITLFDKSFIQSLNVDESVWFDHFFPSNICPLFYAETLADLEKSVRSGRTPEQEVRIISDKFPEMHGTPNAEHVTACTGELLGYPVPMNGQILVAGGKPVKFEGKSGVVLEESPEAKAFSRWQNGEFRALEREYAHGWRNTVTNLDLTEMANGFRKLGVNGKSCKNIEQAKKLASRIVSGTDHPFDRMQLALLYLNIDRRYYRDILQRWGSFGYPTLPRYAPYFSYVFEVELFFQIALAANLISAERPSNRVDIGYLFYLPFSMAFTSSDKLHKKCAPLFLRKNQQFIWGPDFKLALGEINKHYLNLPDREKEKGVMSFASQPPIDGDFKISKLWDFHFQGWREERPKEVDLENPEFKHDALVEHLNRFVDSPEIQAEEVDFDLGNPDSLAIQRMVKKKKGSWFQVPKDLEH